MRYLALLLLMLVCVSPAMAEDYYEGPGLFSTRPDATKSINNLTEFGPVGMSIDLIPPAFTIRIKSIEAGSPAALTGKLKPGMIIESINGKKLSKIDPRIELGNWITEAEAADGKLVMQVADKPGGATQEVVVQLQVLGAYSDTWPLDCSKSDKIVRNFAEHLKEEGTQKGFADIGMLFLLSTGDKSDLAYVREWARNHEGKFAAPWRIGYGGLALCEYYLRTGDKQVLPAIQKMADKAAEMENFGGWAGRGPTAALTYGGGGGHLNAAGTLCVGYLMLAKECGAEVDDATLNRVLTRFFRYSKRGNVPYGMGRPEGGYTDNGKNGKLAFSMAAAASLTPEGEESIYAKARDASAHFSFYSTTTMLHGHTGGGIGEIWRSAAMGLLHEKLPGHYREFMGQRRWHYEMSRRFDGSFAILGGKRYDNTEWGTAYALTYTVPRKTLRLTGAPRTKHSNRYQLPERAWGTAADDAFQSIAYAAYPDGTRETIEGETLAENGGLPMTKRLRPGKADLSTMQKYIRHPDYMTRSEASRSIGKHGPEVLAELMADKDARVRRAALEGLERARKALLTKDVFDKLVVMVNDPEESWYVKDKALQVIGRGQPDWIVAEVDSILPYFSHEEWWLREGALATLGVVVADERVCRKVIPAVAELLRTNHQISVTSPLRRGAMARNLSKARPEVAALIKQSFGEAYSNYVPIDHELDKVDDVVNRTTREYIAQAIARVPGGYDALFEIARAKNPDAPLPYEELFLKADAEKFSPSLQKSVRRIIRTRLVPRYFADHPKELLAEAQSKTRPVRRYRDPMPGLIDLYQEAGVNDYDWHDFGPKPEQMAWQYHLFDPIKSEQIPWDVSGPRYREVTLPKGMEDWHKTEFDPEGAGWKTGLQPFGSYKGKLLTDGRRCRFDDGDFCRHGEPMKTLWDKEVLLLRGKFKFPEFKVGHRYRLLVGGMSHVNRGDGFLIYVNGKPIFERETGVGRRQGAAPIEYVIDQPFWDDFSGKEADLAAISFFNQRNGRSSRHLMIWVQEMKAPPLGEEQVLEAFAAKPMLSSDWQKLQDPDANDLDPEEGKFQWDGHFKTSRAMVGQWQAISYHQDPKDFDPAKPRDARRVKIKSLDLKADGRTDEPLRIWSGKTLIDLASNQALKMQLKSIGGSKYLFVEAGGFSTRNKPDWRSSWIVMKRP